MDIRELNDRLDTIYSIVCWALMAKERYMEILNNKDKFATVFPDVEFSNPRITFSIDGSGEIFSTTKNEIVGEHNHDLFKAWQIALGIAGMTSIMESYLKSTAEKVTGKQLSGMGIFYKFSEETKIDLTEFEDYDKIHKYHEVRNITLHNLGTIDHKFIERVKSEIVTPGPYVFYTIDLQKYRDLIIRIAVYIELKLE